MTVAPLTLTLIVFVIPGIVILRQKKPKVGRGLLYYFKLVRPDCHEQRPSKVFWWHFLSPLLADYSIFRRFFGFCMLFYNLCSLSH